MVHNIHYQIVSQLEASLSHHVFLKIVLCWYCCEKWWTLSCISIWKKNLQRLFTWSLNLNAPTSIYRFPLCLSTDTNFLRLDVTYNSNDHHLFGVRLFYNEILCSFLLFRTVNSEIDEILPNKSDRMDFTAIVMINSTIYDHWNISVIVKVHIKWM